MQIRSRRHSHLLVAVLLLFCMPPLVASANEAADRRAIESAAQRWIEAFNERDAAKLSALVTEDVVVLDGGSSPIAGSKNARDVWLRAASIAEARSVSKEIVVTGDVAWRVGVVMYRRAGDERHTGDSLEIWKRTQAGWKLHRQMSSLVRDLLPRPAPPEPVLDRPNN